MATPETLAPPFPVRSLLLAFAFLVPMNFVVQVYAGSAIAERIGRRGEALLSSAVLPREIIAGKVLPYLALTLALCAVLGVALGGGWLTLLAIVPVAVAFFALEFLAAMVARSFRELTFLTVFASVLITVYAFLPAVFTDLHPVALVSPISLVVMDLRGEVPTLGEALYATLPLLAFGLAVFALGAGLHREEDLFHQKPVPAKLLDALARHVRGPASGAKLAVLLIPAVLVAELLLVAVLAPHQGPLTLPLLLVGVAVIEEAAKGVPCFAAVRRGALPPRRAVLFGLAAGAGFFVAEKALLLGALVGLQDLPAGAALLGPDAGAATGPGLALLPLAALLLAPLALHVLAAGIAAWGAARGKAPFLAALALAAAVHLAYDTAVLQLAARGLLP